MSNANRHTPLKKYKQHTRKINAVYVRNREPNITQSKLGMGSIKVWLIEMSTFIYTFMCTVNIDTNTL